MHDDGGSHLRQSPNIGEVDDRFRPTLIWRPSHGAPSTCGHRAISLPILHEEAVSSPWTNAGISVAMRQRFAAYGSHLGRNSRLSSAMTLAANAVYLTCSLPSNKQKGWPKPPLALSFLAAVSTDMQPLDLVLQQRDRIVRVLQIRDQIGRGAPHVARDIWILYD